MCEDFTGELLTETNETAGLQWFGIDNLPENISPPVKPALKQCVEVLKKRTEIRSENGLQFIVEKELSEKIIEQFVSVIRDYAGEHFTDDFADCVAVDALLAMKHDLKSTEYLVEYFRDGGRIGKNDGAEAVLKKVPICQGCWNKSDVRTQYCTDCFLRACCEEKQLSHCGECGDFPCEKYKDFVGDHEHYKKIMEYLLSIKQNRKR